MRLRDGRCGTSEGSSVWVLVDAVAMPTAPTPLPDELSSAVFSTQEARRAGVARGRSLLTISRPCHVDSGCAAIESCPNGRSSPRSVAVTPRCSRWGSPLRGSSASPCRASSRRRWCDTEQKHRDRGRSSHGSGRGGIDLRIHLGTGQSRRRDTALLRWSLRAADILDQDLVAACRARPRCAVPDRTFLDLGNVLARDARRRRRSPGATAPPVRGPGHSVRHDRRAHRGRHRPSWSRGPSPQGGGRPGAVGGAIRRPRPHCDWRWSAPVCPHRWPTSVSSRCSPRGPSWTSENLTCTGRSGAWRSSTRGRRTWTGIRCPRTSPAGSDDGTPAGSRCAPPSRTFPTAAGLLSRGCAEPWSRRGGDPDERGSGAVLRRTPCRSQYRAPRSARFRCGEGCRPQQSVGASAARRPRSGPADPRSGDRSASW